MSAERLIYEDETGAKIDWTATEEAVRALNPYIGRLTFMVVTPAQWLADLRRDGPPEEAFIKPDDPSELVLSVGGLRVGTAECQKGESVRALIDLLRCADLPVVEVAA